MKIVLLTSCLGLRTTSSRGPEHLPRCPALARWGAKWRRGPWPRNPRWVRIRLVASYIYGSFIIHCFECSQVSHNQTRKLIAGCIGPVQFLGYPRWIKHGSSFFSFFWWLSLVEWWCLVIFHSMIPGEVTEFLRILAHPRMIHGFPSFFLLEYDE